MGRRGDSTGDFLIGLPIVREDSRAELDPILKRGDRVHLMREAEIARWLDPQRFLRLRRAQDDGDELELEYEANDGITLERAIRERLPLELVVDIAKEVADAAASFHRREGLPLREIRIDRILLDVHGRVRFATPLLDLGHPEREPVWEESWHLAPECWARGHYDVRSDIYALGVLLFTMLARATPPSCAEPPLAVLENAGVAEPMIEVIARATSSSPPDRYATIADFKDALDPWPAGPAYAARRTLARLVRHIAETDTPITKPMDRASWGPASPIPAEWVNSDEATPHDPRGASGSYRAQIEALFAPIPSDALLTERIAVGELAKAPDASPAVKRRWRPLLWLLIAAVLALIYFTDL